MDPLKSALILIDIQQGCDPPPGVERNRSTPDLEVNVARLLEVFRTQKSYIIHVHHHSKHATSRLHVSNPAVAARPCAKPLPTEPVVVKSTNSAFLNTPLAEIIQKLNVTCLIFCGTTTSHAVGSTVRMASDLMVVDHGYGTGSRMNDKAGRIIVVSDATAMYDVWLDEKKFDAQHAHEMSLACLADEFAEVETTSKVISGLRDNG